MKIVKQLLVTVVVGIAAAGFNFLYNYIHDDHRGLMMFFCLTTVLAVAIKRRGAG